jgi:hypothetical protein
MVIDAGTGPKGELMQMLDVPHVERMHAPKPVGLLDRAELLEHGAAFTALPFALLREA